MHNRSLSTTQFGTDVPVILEGLLERLSVGGGGGGGDGDGGDGVRQI